MRQVPFGRTGVRVPAIGQGTWQTEDARDATIEALRRGLDLGLTHVDTAEMYGGGRVEELVGEAIRGRRDEVFLVSKVLPSNATYDGTIRACERSLQRLGTDRLDCYLLHWPGSHPLEDTVRAFDDLVRDGKIRAWGVSNFDLDELSSLEELGAIDRCACNQVLYHLGERYIENGLIEWCRERRVSVVAYSPFGQGEFPSPQSRGGKLLAEIGRAHGATARQVALAFLVRDPDVLAIPKASKVRHVEDNAGAGNVKLTKDEIARIDAMFPRGDAASLPSL